MNPTIIIDSREQDPLRFATLPSEEGSLYTGDYSIKGLEHIFAVERKSIPDLVACCCNKSGTENRARFERELTRMRGFRFAVVVVVGTVEDIKNHNYRSKTNPNSVMGSLYRWTTYYNLNIRFIPTREKAARLIEKWAEYFASGIEKDYKHLKKAIKDKPERGKENA